MQISDYNTDPDLASLITRMSERIAALETRQPEAMHYIGASGEPTFTNSWVNYDNGLTTPSNPTGRSVGFYKSGGRVWLSGTMRTGASGTSAFTLPTGYRPAFDSGDMVTSASGAGGLITPMSDGRVIATNLSGGSVTTFVELFGLSFRHA